MSAKSSDFISRPPGILNLNGGVVSSGPSGDRNYYTCSQCERKFRGYAQMNLHIKSHLLRQSFPFRCPDCSETAFVSNKQLLAHRKDVHKVKAGHIKHRRASMGELRLLRSTLEEGRKCSACHQSVPALRTRRMSRDLARRDMAFSRSGCGGGVAAGFHNYIFLAGVFLIWAMVVVGSS